MIFIEVSLVALLILLGIYSSKSDLCEGIIPNKKLLEFLIGGIFLDILYYGVFARDLFLSFVINFAVIFVASLVLFYTHSLAGGDCKLAIVMSALYPANYYVLYDNHTSTLLFSLGFAIFYGYIYITITSIIANIKGKRKITRNYVLTSIISFFKVYFSTLIYICMLNMLLYLVEICSDISISSLLKTVLCIICAWCIGKIHMLKKWYVLLIVVVVDIALSMTLGVIPISTNIQNYIFVFVILLIQIVVKSDMYDEVKVEKLKKGMILSVGSSLLMQKSRIKGLPSISTEDLRDRLSDEQVECIKKWSISRKVDSVYVVKKIPFAIFVFMGYISYLLVWGVLIWK